GIARAAVALGIVGSVLVFGWMQGRVTVSVYNGLARTVSATIDGRRVELQPGASADVTVHGGRDIRIVSTTSDGEPIESFDAPLGF
ncbi:hypothetical protein NQ358_24485, partial [Escherichia coli]|nr:hypothetical protein [Escherichia coli]